MLHLGVRIRRAPKAGLPLDFCLYAISESFDDEVWLLRGLLIKNLLLEIASIE